MVELLQSTTFGNNKKMNHQIFFKIEPKTYLILLNIFVESIQRLFFWYCMESALQSHKNVVIFFKDGWVAIGCCYLPYTNIGETYMLPPPEEVENYVLITPSDIVNINKIKMDTYFFRVAIYMSYQWTDIGLIYKDSRYLLTTKHIMETEKPDEYGYNKDIMALAFDGLYKRCIIRIGITYEHNKDEQKLL